jgi:hypothetical protein
LPSSPPVRRVAEVGSLGHSRMKQKCLACGVEKDMSLKEVYPYAGDRMVIREPIEPLLSIECQGSEDWHCWRLATLCHACYHKLDPDLWIDQDCWVSLSPVTPFEQLPILQTK